MESANHIEGNTIAAILGGISAILAALGVPKIFENWKAVREMKYKTIATKLNETKQELSQVKKDLYDTQDSLKKVSTIVSIIVPMLKIKAQDDKEILELIRIFEKESGINITPNNGREKK